MSPQTRDIVDFLTDVNRRALLCLVFVSFGDCFTQCNFLNTLALQHKNIKKIGSTNGNHRIQMES